MDLVGISVLIIAIAFAVLVIFIARALSNVSKVLEKTEVTVQKLPEQLDEITKETGTVLHNTNETVLDLNEKMNSLNPIFGMVSDAGEASRKLSSTFVDMSSSFKRGTAKAADTTNEQDLSGFFGLAAFIYFLNQQRRMRKEGK